MQYILLLTLCIGTILCDLPELPPELNSIQNKLNEIPGLENLNNDNSLSIDEVLDAAKKKCDKQGGEKAFDHLMAAKDEIQQCIEGHFNFTQIEAELSEKRKSGSMDDVFAKYCAKRSIIEGCVKNFTDAVEPCLENVEKSSLNLLLNVTDNLVDFGCYKDGDRIAMFLAEGGLECIKSKSEGLEHCFNSTLHHRIPANFSITSLPLLVIDEEACDDYSNLQACVIKELETCDDHTPANLVDAIFKYVRRSTPCKGHKSATSLEMRKSNNTNSSSVQTASFLLILISIFYTSFNHIL